MSRIRRPRRTELWRFGVLLVIWLVPAACQPSASPVHNIIKITAGTELIDIPSVTPSPAAMDRLSTSPIVPTTPTLIPSPSPRPSVDLYTPEYWSPLLREVIGELDKANGSWNWQATEDESQADVSLVAGGRGKTVLSRSLALAVPFTTEWEEVSLEEAQSIVAEGHALAKVIDWTMISPSEKALRVNGHLPYEATYPLREEWSLVATPGFQPAAEELAGILLTRQVEKPIIHLAAVGDIMLDRALGYAINQGDIDYPFARVANLLQTADVTIGNLESALGDRGEPASKSYVFRAPPAAAQSLARAGFDVVSLANNHAMDYGPDALLQAIDLLTHAGVATVGAGKDEGEASKPHVIDVNGIAVSFLGYVDVPVEGTGFDTRSWEAKSGETGLSWASPENIASDVKLASQNADLVIVLLHSGFEYVAQPSPPQQAAARAAIDAGAQLVIGHHAHVLQGIEFYGNGVIVYGIGNFAFEIDGDPQTAILNVWLDENGVRQLEIVPSIIQFGGQPRPAESWEAAPILRQVYYLTDLLNPPSPSPFSAE